MAGQSCGYLQHPGQATHDRGPTLFVSYRSLSGYAAGIPRLIPEAATFDTSLGILANNFVLITLVNESDIVPNIFAPDSECSLDRFSDLLDAT